MGSGSYGAGGGGGGGGGGSRSGGEYRSREGLLVAPPVNRNTMRANVEQTLHRLSCDYLDKFVRSPYAQAVYEDLFLLHVDLVTNRSWQGVTDRLNVRPGPRCLSRYSAELSARYSMLEPDQRIRETVAMGVEDFLVRVVRDRPSVFLSGDDADVIRTSDPAVFARTAGVFLSYLIWRMIEREHERLPDDGEAELRAIADALSDRIWARFDRDYRDKPFLDKAQVTSRDMLLVLARSDWFCEEIRK